MNWLLAIPRLFRLPNLIIVFLTQSIPYWFVLRPAINLSGGIPTLTEQSFGLLAATTLLTTLAGYVINDYFDRDIDAVNKKGRQVVGRLIPANLALVLYWIMLGGITFLSLALYHALPEPRAFWPLWVFSAVSGGLFLYAWQLKCTPVAGNLLVSFLCAIVPVILLAPEDRPLWLAAFRAPDLIQHATGLVWTYALFAFITNLLREQVKDLEDFPGDAQCGCSTLAVVKGIRFAKKPAGFTGITVCILLCFLLFFWQETGAPEWQLAAGAVFLLLPAVLATILIYFARLKKHFSWASHCIKLIMVAGLFLLVRRWPDEVNQWLAKSLF